MAVADTEKKESFWKRHGVALLLGGFAALLVVIVLGQLLDSGDIARWLGEVPEGWAYVMCLLLRLVRRGHPDLPRRDDAERSFDDRCRRRLDAPARHGGRRDRRDPRRFIAVLDRPHQHRQDAAPPRQGAGESEGSHRLGKPRPLSRPLDRRRALRPRDALRRQRVDGARPHPLPPLPRLVGHQRHPLVGLHVRARILGVDDAGRLPARLAGHLLAHHVRCSGGGLLHRSFTRCARRRVPRRAARARSRLSRQELPDPRNEDDGRRRGSTS